MNTSMKIASDKNHIDNAKELKKKLQTLAKKGQETSQVLLNNGNVQSFFEENQSWKEFSCTLSQEQLFVFLSIIAIGQGRQLLGASPPQNEQEKRLFGRMIDQLLSIERYYKEMGGIVGYHMTFCQLLHERKEKADDAAKSLTKNMLTPPIIDLTDEANWYESCLEGLKHLTSFAELYPVAGAGDRLDLRDESSGEPLPAAFLPFEGRSLLEGMVRDLQAREYLHFKLSGNQTLLPLALMTSSEKDNSKRITELFERNRWFGRSREGVKLFEQPLVPVLDEEGCWVTSGKWLLSLKPGGHGALWKCALESGIIDWFEEKGCRSLVVRQVNNPLADKDALLLALSGAGFRQASSFGFVGCQRRPNASEGLLAMIKTYSEQDKPLFYVTNIEYTQLKEDPHLNAYPANSNILFADLAAIRQAVASEPYPGLLINLKARIAKDKEKKLAAGRLETTMQNISDSILTEDKGKDLTDARFNKTFIALAPRCKSLSVTKRSWVNGSSPDETPLSAHYDLQSYYHKLFEDCGFAMPAMCSLEEYLQNRWQTLLYLHPALGPMHRIIEQKLCKGALAAGSMLELEIAELFIRGLHLDGSLIICSDQPIGHWQRLKQNDEEQEKLCYSERVGRCILDDVMVLNKGLDRNAECQPWRKKMVHKQSLTIELQGDSEFYAKKVRFEGNHHFVVPDGHFVHVTQAANGSISIERGIRAAATWHWGYSLENKEILLRRIALG